MLDVRQAEQLISLPPETIPDLERRMSSKKISSAHFWETTPGPIARSKLTSNRMRQSSAGFPPPCWNGDRTFAKAEAQ